MNQMFFNFKKAAPLALFSVSILIGGVLNCSAHKRKATRPILKNIIFIDPITHEKEIFAHPYNPFKRNKSKILKREASINNTQNPEQLEQFNQHLNVEPQIYLSEQQLPHLLILPQINQPNTSKDSEQNLNSDCVCPPKVTILKQLHPSLQRIDNSDLNVKNSDNFNS